MMRRALLLLLVIAPYGLLAYDTPGEVPNYWEAACEGRWPGRFLTMDDASVLYDCERQVIVSAADPFGCRNSTLEECYGDE